MKTVRGMDELRGDAHLIMGAAHGAFQQVLDVEALCNLGHFHILALE